MRKLSLRPEELRVQSFPVSTAAVELRGTMEAGMNSVGKTCGNPPDTDPSICVEGRAGPTRPVMCCV